jgi:hypothetical protein
MAAETNFCDPNSPSPTVQKLWVGLDSSKETIEKVIEVYEKRSRLLDGSKEARALGEILHPLTSSYESEIHTLRDFLNLSFDPQVWQETDNFLFDSTLGLKRAVVVGAHALCDVIERTYYKMLRDWINGKLEKEEADTLDGIFRTYFMYDKNFVWQMEQAANFLQESALEIYPLLENKRINEAKEKHRELSQCLKTHLAKLSSAWQKLSNLENEFRKVSSIPGIKWSENEEQT